MFGLMWVLGMGAVAGTTEPDFQANIDKIGCQDPGQTEYEIINGVYNWNQTSGEKLYTCSNVITFGNPGGCGQAAPDGCDYFYGQPTVQVGWFFYASDVISRGLESAGAVGDITNTADTPEFTLFGSVVDTSALALIFLVPGVLIVVGAFMIVRGVS